MNVLHSPDILSNPHLVVYALPVPVTPPCSWQRAGIVFEMFRGVGTICVGVTLGKRMAVGLADVGDGIGPLVTGTGDGALTTCSGNISFVFSAETRVVADMSLQAYVYESNYPLR